MDDSIYRCFISKIFYCDNYFYNFYKNINIEKSFGIFN